MAQGEEPRRPQRRRRLTLAKVFTVTKDEYDLIEDWATHHARLFGARNVFVGDTGSTDPRVLEAYDRLRALGVQVELGHTYAGDGQGESMTRMMRREAEGTAYLVGLDTDEFLVGTGEEGGGGDGEGGEGGEEEAVIITVDPLEIRRRLLALPRAQSTFVYARAYDAAVLGTEPWEAEDARQQAPRPAADIVRFTRRETLPHEKRFCAARRFVRAGNGCHEVETSKGSSGPVETIGLLHFHDTGRRRSVERAAATCVGYGYISEADDEPARIAKLEAVPPGNGEHRVHEYLRVLREARDRGWGTDDPRLYLRPPCATPEDFHRQPVLEIPELSRSLPLVTMTNKSEGARARAPEPGTNEPE